MTVQTQTQIAKTAAQNVMAGMNLAALAALTAELGQVETQQKDRIAQAVNVAMAYLVNDGATQPMNDLLEALTVGNRRAVESLIQWASVYQLTLKNDDKDQTLKIVGGKVKGRKEKKVEIEEAANSNYNRFVNHFGGSIWNWVTSSDREHKKSLQDNRKAEREAVEAAKPEIKRFEEAKIKFEKSLTGLTAFDEVLKAEIMNLVNRRMAEKVLGVAGDVNPE